MEFLKQIKKDYYYILTINSVRHLIVHRDYGQDYCIYDGSKDYWRWGGYVIKQGVPEYTNIAISHIDNLTLHVINTQNMIESVLDDE